MNNRKLCRPLHLTAETRNDKRSQARILISQQRDRRRHAQSVAVQFEQPKKYEIDARGVDVLSEYLGLLSEAQLKLL